MSRKADALAAVIMTAVLAALIVAGLLLAFWIGFFAVAGAEEPVTNNACTGHVIGYGTLTADSTGEGFAIGDGMFLAPRPDTPAEMRLREFQGRAVELLIRPAK
jgi:hypothetical protein